MVKAKWPNVLALIVVLGIVGVTIYAGVSRNRVFEGRSVLITRTVKSVKPRSMDNSGMRCLNMDKSVASIRYNVQYGTNYLQWVNIDLSPEAHSWCEQRAF